jgi:hypothetical protein
MVSYRRWPADNRPQDGYALVVVHAPGGSATVQIELYRRTDATDERARPPEELGTADALFLASVEAAMRGLVVYVAMQEGAEWNSDLGRLID